MTSRDSFTRDDFKNWGRKGGNKSWYQLTDEEKEAQIKRLNDARAKKREQKNNEQAQKL